MSLSLFPNRSRPEGEAFCKGLRKRRQVFLIQQAPIAFLQCVPQSLSNPTTAVGIVSGRTLASGDLPSLGNASVARVIPLIFSLSSQLVHWVDPEILTT